MKRTRIWALLAALMLGAAGTLAYAWGGGQAPCGMIGFGPGGGGPAGWGNPAAHAEARLAYIKSDLAITAEQEPAWNAYAEAVRGQAGAMFAARQADGTAQERRQMRQKLMEERLAGMKRISEAGEALYAVLTPEQQKKADQSLIW